MGYFLYIIECSDGSLYTGWTTDIRKRLDDHNSGKGAKYTRGRRPVVLKFLQEFPTKSMALKMERKIKQMSRKEKLALIQNQTLF